MIHGKAHCKLNALELALTTCRIAEFYSFVASVSFERGVGPSLNGVR